MTMWPVTVEFDVRRTVYVHAPSEAAAKRLALDPTHWADAEDPRELLDTIRVVG